MPDVTVKFRHGLLLSLGLWACAGVVAAAQEREQAERDLSEVSAAIADIQAWLQQARLPSNWLVTALVSLVNAFTAPIKQLFEMLSK